MPQGNNGIWQYIKLEQRLTLLAWLNSLFGYHSNKELLADLKETGEGFDAEGRSYIYHSLTARGRQVKIAREDLLKYDDHIRLHLKAINAMRPEPITLRYFQYLAVLYSEIFLDRYFGQRKTLLKTLNDYVIKRNSSRVAGEPADEKFAMQDLTKLAFWMATGSGKTLLMHLNYRQFLHYNNQQLDNILLITPNDGLSNQHLTEMALSGIPCRRFDLNESGLNIGDVDVVRVIEITKLVEQKRGSGQSVPVEAFEGKNLIFVDEGHKGSGGEVWRAFREALGKTGFTFEYSATFGQALTASKNDTLTAEYGKAIVFDYSYRYFHGDGYGKDFSILNLKQESTEEGTETLLLGNLLSFYEQQRVYHEQQQSLHSYNLEQPLWVFVGSTVNVVYTREKQKRSDVLTIVRFLHHLLGNHNRWATKTIQKLLDGKSGLIAQDGRDVFDSSFKYLRSTRQKADTIYRNILVSIFHATAGGALHLTDMRGNPGELGLKAGGAENYFGLIYIGDTSSFKQLVEGDNLGIVLEEDAISPSLFDRVNNPDSHINVLIGAKKFMEGWNSWRVSNMGLLNIGRKEGSEIIQLFGRGVRLKGKNLSLKRSAASSGPHPEHIGLLETLNIFAVRANYMTQFREYLEKEGVETEEMIEISLPIKPNHEFLGKDLVIPRIPEGRSFISESDILLKPDPTIRVRVDISMQVQLLTSDEVGISDSTWHSGQERSIPDSSLEFVDWESVFLELLTYKEEKDLTNLVIPQSACRGILATNSPTRLYSLIADESIVRPHTFEDRVMLQEAVGSILKKYIDKFYRVHRERWNSEHMTYQVLNHHDPNFQNYIVKIPRSENDLINSVVELINEADRIYQEERTELPSVHFDRHLYQPLLIEREGVITVEPPRLKPSESRFVNDLKDYYRSKNENTLSKKEVYLLRNLSLGKGVSFFESRGFYPDFILWIVEEEQQRIIFIEPHGMLHSEAYANDEKARLHENLPRIASEIGKRTKKGSIALDSFIVSSTSFEDLQSRYDDGSWDIARFARCHILFQQERTNEYDYIQRIFQPDKKN